MGIITAYSLCKSFGKKAALRDIDLEVDKGSIYGIIGPNGAGKTTFISILSTLLRPSKGNVTICGYDLKKNPGQIRKRIGVVFQESIIDSSLSAYDNLEIQAMLYDMPKKERKERIEYIMRLLDLSDAGKALVKTFSGGMRRKVEVARSLLHSPDLLILDEPTLGIDPRTRLSLWEYLLKINSLGVTIFIATNYMEEAEFLCSHVAVFNAGKIVVSGKKDTLVGKVKDDTVLIETTEPGAAAQCLRIYSPKMDDFLIELKMKDAERKLQHIVSMLSKGDVKIHSIKVVKPSLSDVFLKYTGEVL